MKNFNYQADHPIAEPRSEMIMQAAYRMARVFVKLFSPYLQTAVLAEMVTQAGVENAEKRCKKEAPGQKITLSKLSLMTGTSTAIIKGLQKKPRQIGDYQVCAEAAILARWCKDPELRSLSGKPADLPIFGPEGSFQSLVTRQAGRGISTRTVLDRMIATGNLEIVNRHFVRIIDANWRFIEDNEDQFLDYGTQAIASLATTVENNLQHRNNPEGKLVERRIYSIKIPEKLQDKVRKGINEILMRQKEEVGAYIRSFEDNSLAENTGLVGVGYYHWQSSPDESDFYTNLTRKLYLASKNDEISP
jgi:hypothetical protein